MISVHVIPNSLLLSLGNTGVSLSLQNMYDAPCPKHLSSFYLLYMYVCECVRLRSLSLGLVVCKFVFCIG